MTVHRFFIDPGTISGESFPVPDAIAHQVRRVLRLADGALIVLLEGDDQAVTCRLAGSTLEVVSRELVTGEPRHRLTIAQALLKGDHLETVVRTGTEVGVARFELLITTRTVVRELSPRRLARLRAVAREAAEQSERGQIPEVVGPLGLADLTRTSVYLAERSAKPRLSALGAVDRLVIGPEGGFADEELAGRQTASLGSRILRSETVAATAAAVVLSGTGDFA